MYFSYISSQCRMLGLCYKLISTSRLLYSFYKIFVLNYNSEIVFFYVFEKLALCVKLCLHELEGILYK